MPVRVLDKGGRGRSEGVAQSIRYAVENGVLVVAAAGNSPYLFSNFPASGKDALQ